MNILITEPGHYSDTALDLYRSCGKVELGVDPSKDLTEQVGEVEVLVLRLRYSIGLEILEAAPRLKMIVTPTTGLDHLDQDGLRKRGIGIISLKGETGFLRSIPATAELTWGLLLAARRNIVPAANSVIAGGWVRDLYRGSDLKGKTLGILGCGRIGSMVAGYAKAFGMRVLAHDRQPIQIEGVEKVSVEALYCESDVISVHLPLEKDTEGFVDRKAFGAMKLGAIFINTARSGIVDEASMLDALASGSLAAAAVDVLSGEENFAEKISDGHPMREYAKHNDNLLITPHIGGASWDSMHATEIFCAERFTRMAARLFEQSDPGE